MVMRNIGTLSKLVSLNQVTNHRAVTMSKKLVMMKRNRAVKMSKEIVRMKSSRLVVMKVKGRCSKQ